MLNPITHNKFKNGQTVIELAIFGSVFLFIIGAIIRQSAGSGLQQNQQLRAFRVALADSHMYSEGLKGTASGTSICGAQMPDGPYESSGGGDGEMSRNSASIILLEDRLNVGSAKYAEIDRTPYLAQGSATHTRNLFMPFDWGECHNIPVFDVYMNGKHIPFITADFVQTVFTFGGTNPENQYVYEAVPNHPAFQEKWVETDEAFDLDRDGDTDVPAGELRELRNPDSPEGLMRFSWQWHKIPVLTGDINNGSYDVDGDLKEEYVMKVDRVKRVEDDGIEYTDVIIKSLDYQEGDMDFTVNDRDKNLGAMEVGLQRDMYMFTEVKPGDGGEEGSYLQIEEGQLINNWEQQIVRSVQRKDQIDVIQRRFIMSRNTGRFCSRTTYEGPVTWEGEPNPVEACCLDNNSDDASKSGCCFTPENVEKTCMAPNPAADDINQYPIMYIRTRIEDRRGRKWITNINSDPTVGFLGQVYSDDEGLPENQKE